jgi:predicted extracellular nuclease
MRFLALIIGALTLILAGVGVQNVYATPIRMIINEFYRGGNLETTDEWIEILLVEDLTATQLNGFFVGDSTAATASKFTGFQFTNMGTIAATFPRGTLIVVGGTTALTQDTSYNPGGGDWNILLRTSGGFLTEVSTPVGNTSDIAATDVVYVDTNGTTGDTTISTDGFAVNWDTSPGTLGGVANVLIAVPANNTGVVLTSDFAGATTPANWTVSVALGSMTPGQPNGGTNTTYITALRAGASDTAPTVSSTTPTDTATSVLVGSNITINFSEPVDVTASGVTVECPVGTPITFTGLPVSNSTSVVLDPSVNLPTSTICTVTVVASQVSDLDGTIDYMASNYTFTFTIEAPLSIIPIHTVQGTVDAVAMNGSIVTVQAIVTADYQGTGVNGISGFFIQEEDADIDGNIATSEGIFIYCNTCPTAVNVGDEVQVTGLVSDNFGMSQISATAGGSVVIVSSGNPMPTVSPVTLPVPLAFANFNDYYEQFEGMLTTFTSTLTVSEYFELFRFGEVVLYAGGRPYQYTHIDNSPTAPEYTTYLADLARRRITLDDSTDTQNASLTQAPQRIAYPQPGGLSIGTQGVNYFRGGDTVNNLTGVLQYSFSEWRIRPTSTVVFTASNPRPSAPTVTGDIVVASFNVLNYFTTVDTTASNNSGFCSPSGTLDCRGADSNAELTRQTDKLVTALSGINADIFGLIEIENIAGSATVASLVGSLNAVVGAGTYDYVNTGAVGTDAITNAFIYKPAVVQVVSFYTDTDPINDRPTLAVLFEVIDPTNPSFGEQFNVVVNHFKSKGSSAGLPGDTDQGDGQGQSNATRTAQANRLITWVNATLVPNDPDVLVIGDLNSYKGENPISTLLGAGYTDLAELFGGANAYSYVFDGQLGYLDHALANASLLPYITDTVDWHINADEIPLFDYNDDVRDTGEAAFEEEPDANPLYEVNPFRTSDHDPVVVGISFPQAPLIVTGTIEIVGAGSLASINPATPALVTTPINNIAVTFNMDVNYGNPADPDHADNPANYILLAEGAVAGFQTTGATACMTGVNAGDTAITFTVAFNNTTNTTTLTVTGASPFPPLTIGKYSLIICGSTSITNLAGVALDGNGDGTPGDDVQYYFDVVATTTDTGGTGTGTTTTGTTLTQQEVLATVKALPATGETPWWRDVTIIILLLGGFVVTSGMIWLRFRRAQ